MNGIDQFPVVVVGGGPVGLTTSILLSRLGVRHAVFERHPGTSVHPKAVGLNQRTIEILRAAGLAKDIEAAAAPPHTVGRTAWYTSFGGPTPLHGRRIAVRDAWGVGVYADEYAQASPARYTVLPQIRLEPILRAHAESSPLADVVFGACVTEVAAGRDDVTVTVEHADGTTRRVRADYLVAADGGRTVADRLGIRMIGPTNLVDMVSAHFGADLSGYLPDDGCLINWFVNPDFGGSIGSGYLYHLGPWSPEGVSEEWVFACGFHADDPERFDEEGMRGRIIRSLGLPDLDISLRSISHWYLQAVVAERFREGRCFLVGDAAHRIPPWGALGLNTGIQDAHNLVWKIAAALRDSSLKGLLDSYETERRPVAVAVAETSLHNFRNHGGVVDVALGLSPDTAPEEGWAALETLWSDGPEGDAKRAAVAEAMRLLDKEFHAHGAENGFAYQAGALVPEGGSVSVPEDMLVYRPTSAPGHHVPHTWLATPAGRASTLDLAAPGRFALVVDERADAWRTALAGLDHPLARLVDVAEVGTSPGKAYHDTEGRWERLREVGGDGALLVRPDTVVAWRHAGLPREPRAALREALDTIAESAGVGPSGDPATA
ncbi:FAD-dependent monooxygenase [Microbispora sp. NPDC046933]|uniref:FAD-dependent monooxygenase n=1 Tax=Microbispora sp. NPDC046933 TaxID=3155618 RepID=UPI0033C28B01